jgi:hypothetical protein
MFIINRQYVIVREEVVMTYLKFPYQYSSEVTETEPSYLVGSKSFRPDHLFKVTEIKQLCYFST